MWSKSVTCVCAALAMLTIAAGPAAARTKATIPFDFIVYGKLMPAGEYSIDMNAGQSLVQIRGAKGHKAMTFLSREVGVADPEIKPRLVFHRQGENLVLKEIRTDAPVKDEAVYSPAYRLRTSR